MWCHGHHLLATRRPSNHDPHPRLLRPRDGHRNPVSGNTPRRIRRTFHHFVSDLRHRVHHDFFGPPLALLRFSLVVRIDPYASLPSSARHVQMSIAFLTQYLSASIYLVYVVPWPPVLAKTVHSVLKSANATRFS